MRAITSAMVIATLLLLVGCATSKEPAAATAEAPQMRALGATATVEEGVSDEAIGHEVRRRLALANPHAMAAVIIEVSDGVVTLRGSVPNIAVAWQAEAAATSTRGTKQVHNELLTSAATFE